MASSTRVVAGPLRLVGDLCAALDRAGVAYCHWKSTDALDRSASGENDLDLLVAEGDVPRFLGTLRELGFVEGVVPASQLVPGVRHFYGLDAATTRLVDVHAHERLVLGDDATKNYRLPIEESYLATASRDGLFPVPSRDAEYAVFIVRMMLKHGSPEAIATGRGRLSYKDAEELRHLREGAHPGTPWASVVAVAPMLDRDLLVRCADALRPGVPLLERLDAWGGLRERLAPYARRTRALDVWLQVERRLAGRARRLLGRRRRKRLPGRGCVIALVGSDGSGKSTTAAGIVGLFSPVFVTARIHLGKPTRSVMWRMVRAWLHLGRRLGLRAAAIPAAEDGGAPASRSRLLIDALTARDRRRAVARAQRLAARGGIAVCDRYPLPELSVDGPRTRVKANSGLAGWLVALERRQHTNIPPPDLVVVLAVPPEVAKRRRPEADPALIDARAREILDARWPPGTPVIDAARSRQEVLAEVALRVWEVL